MSTQARRKLRRDWSSLPADAIEFISSLIADDADYVRFRSVCSSWRSAAPKRPQIPWLLVIDFDEYPTDPIGLALCNFPNSDYSATPRLPFGIIQGKSLCGSSRGWIALLDDSTAISLYNPFIAVHINLPSLANLPWINKSDQGYIYRDRGYVYDVNSYPNLFANKLVLSSDPRIQSCIAMTFSNNRASLMYCHPADGSWTPLPPLPIDDLDDILFYRGKFYVVRTYKMFVCDIGPENAQVTEILPREPLFSDGNPREGYSYYKTSYLVDSAGDLLLVSVRYPHFACVDCDNITFEVFRVDVDFGETPNGRLGLLKLDNLGGRSLFIGFGSMSVSAGSYPLCKGNSIYFIPEPDVGMFGVLVFSMDDGKCSSFTGFSGVREDDDVSYGTSEETDDGDLCSDDGFPENGASDCELYWFTPSLC